MRLPCPDVLCDGLKRWRIKHGWKPADVARNSETSSVKPFDGQDADRWEKGTHNFSYERLVEDILPAYHIDDFDIFLDDCIAQNDSASVLPIRSKDLTEDSITFGVKIKFCKPGYLTNYPTRIDQLIIEPGKQSTPKTHLGHEYLLVLSGKARFHFKKSQADTENTSLDLLPGDAVTFSSHLYHSIENCSNDGTDAIVVVGRPSWSGPI